MEEVTGRVRKENDKPIGIDRITGGMSQECRQAMKVSLYKVILIMVTVKAIEELVLVLIDDVIFI